MEQFFFWFVDFIFMEYQNTQLKMETLTLFMYLHPQPDLFVYLHPQSADSIFQSQLFAFSIEQLDGCCCGGCGSASMGGDTSVRVVIPGIVSIDGESKCGDNDCIRGKSISIILNSLEFYFIQWKIICKNKNQFKNCFFFFRSISRKIFQSSGKSQKRNEN